MAAPRPEKPVRIAVYVQPGASRTMSAGRHGDALKIRIAAKPVDNAANLALIEFIADAVGVARRQVRVVAGAGSRHKMVEIDVISAERASAALGGSENAP
jgi:uncharacterized protein (TIGR00251 family)